MQSVLLGAVAIAAVAVFAAPADAQRSSGGGLTAVSSTGFGNSHGGVNVHRDSGRDRDRRDRRRHGHRGDRDIVVGSWYQSQDWDGNRSFDADKWNDWWHERPWRSHPAWMARNQNCERKWWSGEGWRC